MYIGGLMGKKKSKRDRALQTELELTAISMACFMRRYLGIMDEELLKMGLTHRELATLCPHLRRSSFALILSSPELVYLGDVILVDDGSGNIIPYVFDNHLKELSSDDQSQSISDTAESKTWSDTKETDSYVIIDSDLDSMSIYELENLAKHYSRTGQERKYRKVIRTIVSRDDSIQASRQSKSKALRKERKYNAGEFD